MADTLLAADKNAVNELLRDAQTDFGTKTRSGSSSLGPFHTNWSASGFFSGGTIDLFAPSLITLIGCELHYTLNFNFQFALGSSSSIPKNCLPQICKTIFGVTLCTPLICFGPPSITIPVSYTGVAKFNTALRLNTYLSGANWKTDAVMLGVPGLQLGVAPAALLAAIGGAVVGTVAPIPFFGMFAATAMSIITSAIGINGVTNFIKPILAQFLPGLRFNLATVSRIFTVLPAELPLSPTAAMIKLDTVAASIVETDEKELVFEFNYS